MISEQKPNVRAISLNDLRYLNFPNKSRNNAVPNIYYQ